MYQIPNTNGFDVWSEIGGGSGGGGGALETNWKHN